MLKNKCLIITLLACNNSFTGDRAPLRRQLTPTNLKTTIAEARDSDKRPEFLRDTLDLICNSIREKVTIRE